MGFPAYSGETHHTLTEGRAELPREQIFIERGLHPDMNPFGVRVRESRDSALHPASLAIIFALDETGSMGHLPDALVRKIMPDFMSLLLRGGFVTDPQILFAGIGDASMHEVAPLQVGQFESGAEDMDKWLTKIFLEGRGGGNHCESYEFPMYFAARHTSIDCLEKRGKKGYLFITGDEQPPPYVSAAEVRRYIGDDLARDIPIAEMIAEVSKMYNVFFLIPDLGRRMNVDCEKTWRKVLGDQVICMESHEDTCVVAASIIGLNEGVIADIPALATKLEELGVKADQRGSSIRAVEAFAASIGRGGEMRQAQDADFPSGQGARRTRRRT